MYSRGRHVISAFTGATVNNRIVLLRSHVSTRSRAHDVWPGQSSRFREKFVDFEGVQTPKDIYYIYII